VGIPLNTSLEREDLTMQPQLIQCNRHLLNPCDASRTPLDAEDDMKRKKKLTLSSRRSSSRGQERCEPFEGKVV